jgi:hypothetical protein
MCGACNASYYNIFSTIYKTLNKRNSYEKIKVLGAMCKVIGILLFFNIKMVASKEEPMVKMSTMSV